MIFTGKCIWAGEPRKGTNEESGAEWIRQDFTIQEVSGDYPQTAVITLSRKSDIEDYARYLDPQKPLVAEYHIGMTAREWNGKWFNNIRCWKIEGVQVSSPMADDPKDEPQAEATQEELPF